MSASTRRTGPAAARAALRRRARGAALIATALAVVLAMEASGPAAADNTATTPGSATTQSAAATKGSGVTFTATGTGMLGTLSSALLNSALATNSATLPSTVTSTAATALTSTAGLQATNASTRVTRPSPVTNYPACNAGSWVYPGGNCYAVVNPTSTPTLPAASLLALSAGTVNGYATGDDQGFVSAAGTSHPVLVVPGLAIDLGVASSNVQCTTTPTCTPAHAFSNASITTTSGSNTTTQSFTLASGGSLATLGNTSIPDGQTVPTASNLVNATANGNFVTFTVSLTLAQYLALIGTSLTSLSAGLTGALAGVLSDNGSTITLAVTVGPGSITGSSSTGANAWGLEVGVNLIADIKLKLNAPGTTSVSALGIVTTIAGNLLGSTELVTQGASSYPATAGSTPNLLDLKFAYSQGAAGALLPDFIPPALI